MRCQLLSPPLSRWVVACVVLMASAQAKAQAPLEFELLDLSGQVHTLSEYRGSQWVVVNFWATWCAPCRKEIPDLSRLHDARDDVTVLGLAFEDISVDMFEAFLEDYPASYPILMVDTFNPPEAFEAPRALPTTHLLNPQGHAVETWLGPVTSEMITARIGELQALE